MKALVVYFSAEMGKTEEAAKTLAETIGCDLFEIKPAVPYTSKDLNWANPLARCNREKLGRKDVPVDGVIEDFVSYDLVCIGFPIWYGGAPNVVNTFAKGYDWTGKKVAIFATSGGSGIGRTAERLAPCMKGADIIGAEVIRNSEGLGEWVDNVIRNQ